MKVFIHITKFNTNLSCKNAQLIISTHKKEKGKSSHRGLFSTNNTEPASIPCSEIECLIIEKPDTKLSNKVITEITHKNGCILFLDLSGKTYSIIHSTPQQFEGFTVFKNQLNMKKVLKNQLWKA